VCGGEVVMVSMVGVRRRGVVAQEAALRGRAYVEARTRRAASTDMAAPPLALPFGHPNTQERTAHQDSSRPPTPLAWVLTAPGRTG
jgi:hypothetical protein